MKQTKERGRGHDDDAPLHKPVGEEFHDAPPLGVLDELLQSLEFGRVDLFVLEHVQDQQAR